MANKDTALKWGFGNEIIKIIYSCSNFANILQGRVFSGFAPLVHVKA